MTPSSERHHGLDATRGLCALLVAIFHFLHWSKIGEYPSLGLYAVYAFFTLSSVTLCVVYGQRFSAGISARDLTRYALNRAARILPLLAVVAAIALVLDIWQGGDRPTEVWKFIFTASGLFAFGPAGSLGTATGSWSLGIEILFYFLFPVLCLLLINRRPPFLVGLSVAMLLTQSGYSWLVLHSDTLVHRWEAYISPLSFVFYFAAGFAGYRANFVTRFNLVLGLIFVIAATCASVVLPATDTALLLPPYSLVLPIAIAIGVSLIFHSRAHPATIRVFEFLGAISYSSYLLHPLVYLGIGIVTRHLHIGADPVLQALLFFPGTIAISYLSFRLFEIKARNWIRRLAGEKPALVHP